MCNYGAPGALSAANPLESVQFGLASLTSKPSTIWVGAYSLLDDREVPCKTRRKIFEELAKSSADTIWTETHVLSIKPKTVQECVEILQGKKLVIQLGIESMDFFTRRWCLNKPITDKAIRIALSSVKDMGAACYANLLLGSPFMTERESILDVLTSINECLSMGFDGAVLFPSHVKPHTLVHWLYERNQHRPITLWALVEVLKRVDRNDLSRVMCAWFEPVNFPGAVPGLAPLAGEDTNCILDSLRKFHATNDTHAIEKILSFTSPAYVEWQSSLSEQTQPLSERIKSSLLPLADEVLGKGWWERAGAAIIDLIESDWSAAQANNKHSTCL